MAITPVSSAALAYGGARTLLRASATFQARIAAYHGGAADTANAAKHIYGHEIFNGKKKIALLRPCALLVMTGQTYAPLYEDGSLPALTLSDGQIALVITDKARHTDAAAVGAPDAQDDSYIDFLNFAFGVADDLSQVFGGNNYPFTGIQLIEAPDRPTPAEQKSEDFWIAIFALEYGLKRAGG